ncbi:MAG: zf-HC2 domain-containing protein [Planctomycetota bacterium]|nr:zf-HC2 domain-containing protein [Planctomycetota bacterium]
MNCEEARNLMVLHLYGEMSQEDGEKLRAHLADCFECSVYFAEIESANELLKQLPSFSELSISIKEVRLSREAKISRFGRVAGVAVFASLAAAILIGLILHFSSVVSVEVAQNGSQNAILFSFFSDFARVFSSLEYDILKIRRERGGNDALFTIRVSCIEREMEELQNALKEESLWD